MLEEDIFNSAVDEGARSSDFTKLIEWITNELAAFTGIEDKVNTITCD